MREQLSATLAGVAFLGGLWGCTAELPCPGHWEGTRCIGADGSEVQPGAADPGAEPGDRGYGGGDPDSTGTGDGTASTDDSIDAPSDNALGQTITFELEPFEVRPGSERQVCKVVNVPSDVAIDVVRFHSAMSGTSHHFNVYKMLGVTSDASPAEAVVHDCSPGAAQLAGDGAFIFGSSEAEHNVDMPAGVAFHLEPNQQIVLEHHVINATGQAIDGSATLDIVTTGDPAAIQHHADIIWFANWSFLLTPGESSATTHCTVPYDVEVYALTSHFHAHGTRFSIEKWSAGNTEHLYETPSWEHPDYLEYDPTVHLAAGEGLQWTCTWRSNGGIVLPGRNATDEMCITFAAAYPTNSLDGDPIQCNNGL